tara:strand:- start:639 stop:1568 length:930 start_codon:yes stop_codon:yes gene_type:complete
MHHRVFRDKWALDGKGKLNTRKELMQYCDSLAISSGEKGRKHYVDPACGIAYNQSTCVGTALLGDAVKHTHALKDNLWEKFTQSSVNALGQGTPLRCACQGPAFEWAREVKATDEHASSFMSKYETHAGDPRSRLRHCTADNIIINNCDYTIKSGSGNINNTNSKFQCYNQQSSIARDDSSAVSPTNYPSYPSDEQETDKIEASGENIPASDSSTVDGANYTTIPTNYPSYQSGVQETDRIEPSGENIQASDSSTVDANYTPIRTNHDPAKDPPNADKQPIVQEMDKFGLSPSILVILGIVAVLFILLN